jgi:hypothetical protein
MKYDSVVESLGRILLTNFNIKIDKLATVVKIISTWGNEIGYDLKPFTNMKEIIEEGYVYYETIAKVRSKEALAFEFGEQYLSCEEVTIVISGDAYGLHPEKERAYLALHESDDDMEYLEQQAR